MGNSNKGEAIMSLFANMAKAVLIYFVKKHAVELVLDAVIEAAEAGSSHTAWELDDKAAKALRNDREAILKIVKDFL